MRIAFLLSLILILLVSQTTLFGQCISKPQANFSLRDTCGNDTVKFLNSSQGGETYIWKFCDGDTSIDRFPKHYFGDHIHAKPCGATLIVLDSNECLDTIFKWVIWYANPNSDFTYTYSGKNWSFLANPSGIKYRWFFGDRDSANTRNASHTYKDTLSSHTVCLEVTNAAGCISQTCIQTKTVEISTLTKPQGFKIYPNPNSGSFEIELEVAKTDNHIEIINQIGQTVYRAEFNQSPQRLDLNLSKGIYLVKVIGIREILIHRMLVNK